MVRLKSRWIIFRIEFERDVLLQQNNNTTSFEQYDSNDFLTPKDLAQAIQASVDLCFGDSASAAALGTNLQIRFCDSATRLAVVRVPRDYCSLVRTALSYVTVVNKKRISLTTCSMHGTARTAKVAVIRLVTKKYRDRLLFVSKDERSSHDNNSSLHYDRLCSALENTLKEVTFNF